MSSKNIIAKTEEYLGVPSVVGFEGPFMDYLSKDFDVEGYEVEKQDKILAVRKKGVRSPKVVTAHIDRHGLVIGDYGKPEYAAFNAKKHYRDENQCSEEVFRKSGERFVGEQVYAYDENGTVIGEGIVRDFFYNFESKDLLFEVDGLRRIPSRTPIAFVSPLVRENGNLSSQIDNSISVAVTRQLVEDGFDGTLLFSAEEEIGRSWKHIVDYLSSRNIDSKEIITLDTTPYEDSRAISEGLIVFRNKDEKGVFNPSLVKKLKEGCDSQGIKYEMKDEVIEAWNSQLRCEDAPKKLGKTELGRIVHHSGGNFNGATIQLPTTNYHTNHETSSELALNNYYEALKGLL